MSTRKSKGKDTECVHAGPERVGRKGKGVFFVSLALVLAVFAGVGIFESEKIFWNGPSGDTETLGSFDPTAGTIDLSTITAGSYNGYSYNAGTITFTQDADGLSYLITQSNSSAVSINIIFAFPSGISTTVAISGINITGNISLQGSATLDLLLTGSNTVSGSILVPSGTAVTIDSTDGGTSNGTVTVNAGSNKNAGIGGAAGVSGGTAGTITINGGTVNATGGNNGAGIGGGASGDGGTITITGGTVNATGGGWGGAGIGGGSGDPSGAYSGAGGTITITGGTVNATGNSSSSFGYVYNVGGGAGIGGAGANNNSGNAPWAASGDSGNITISGSANVTATGGTGGAYYGAGGAGIGSGGAAGNNVGSTVGLAGVSASTVLDINANVTAVGGPGSSSDAVLQGANIGFGGGYASVDGNSGKGVLPAAPTNLKATPLANGQVSLAWDAGGTDYFIVLNGVMIDRVSSNSYTADVSVGTNNFTVRATNSQATVIGPQSNIVTVYGITLNTTGDGTVDVSFTDQGGTPTTFTDAGGVVTVDVTQVTFTATANPGSVLLNIAQNSGTPATTSPQTYTVAPGDTISVLFGLKDYVYEITGDTVNGFTVTGYADSGSDTYTPGSSPFTIQTAIETIRSDADGNDCTITFGGGTALNIDSNNITFDSSASPGWGSVILLGELASTYNGTGGVITMTGAVNVTSGATITSASAPAIRNNGTGALEITGGSLQNTGSGAVISNAGSGNVTITDAVISASGTTAIDMSAGALSLGGDPAITGAISIPVGMLSIITSGDNEFAPVGKTYSVTISSGEGNNEIAVSAGTGFVDNFVLTNSGYMLYDDGTDLTMKIQRTVTLTVVGGGSVDATVIGNTVTYGSGVYSVYVPDGIGLDIVSVGNETSAFSRWISATNSMNSLIDTASVSSVTTDLAVTAVFVTGGLTLSVNLDGEGSVAVTMANTAAGSSTYTITDDEVIPIASGDSISMVATGTGSTFSRWVSGTADLNSLDSTVTTTASGSLVATAFFVNEGFTLSANLNGTGSVDVTINGAVYTISENAVIPTASGDPISMTATGTGSAFSRWVSDTPSLHLLSNNVSATVSGSLVATAFFVTGGLTLTANTNGTGSVAVTINGDAYTVTNNTVIPVASGDTISMVAAGSTFSRWVSGTADLNSLSNNVSTTISGSLVATAVFVPGTLTLTANLNGSGSVSVTITNAATGSSVYAIEIDTTIPVASGDSISMTATGSTFSRWTSDTADLNSLGSTVSTTASGSLTATAVFVPGTLTLTVNISGSGSAAVAITNVSGVSAYTVTAARTTIPIASGDSISMTATGSAFSRWVSGTADLNSLGSNVSTTVSSSLIATAVFVTGGLTLSANINGAGSVAVTVNGAAYTITANTVIPISSNDSISMTATGTGSTFSRWVSATTDLHSLSNTVSVTVTGSMTATAFFVSEGYALTANISGTGSVAVTISGAAYTITANTVIPIATNDPISMTATGTGGYAFSRWVIDTASLQSFSNNISVTATGSLTVTAFFVTGGLTLTVNISGSGSVAVTINGSAYTVATASTVIPIASGNTIIMNATGTGGYAFSRWISDTASLNRLTSNASSTASGSLVATAVFVPSGMTLTANISGTGSVAVTIANVSAGSSTYTITANTVIPIASGDSVSMTATGTGSTFSRWVSATTDLHSLNGTVSTTASSSMTAAAVFVPGSLTLSADLNGSGSVAVTVNGAVYTITANTVIPIASGDSVSMVATGTGSTFSRWVSVTADLHSLNGTVSTTATGSLAATAFFVTGSYTLTANLNGTGSVDVTINGAVYTITANTVIPIASGDGISMAATGSTFSRWISGTADLNSLGSEVTTTASDSMTATAVFVPGTLTLTANISGSGSVAVTITNASGSSTYAITAANTVIPIASGDFIELTATGSGSTFSRWVGSTGSLHSLSNTVSTTASDSSLTATAVFVTGGFTLSANLDGTGSVAVMINGAVYTIISGTAIPVASGDTIFMNATATGSTFSRWVSETPSMHSLSSNVSATVSGSLTATAVFVTGSLSLITIIDGTGSVDVAINGAVYTPLSGIMIPVASGDSISMTATGNSFSRWISLTGSLNSLSDTVSTTVSGNLAATAVFVTGSSTLTANIDGTGSVAITINNATLGNSIYTITASTLIPLDSGDSISMTATGTEDFAFSRWEGDGATLSGTATVVADGSMISTAVFVDTVTPNLAYDLTVNIIGSGSVALTINGNDYDLTGNTVIPLEWNAVANLTAVETDANYTFSRWEGDGAALSEDTSVTIRADRTSTAVFVDTVTADEAYDLTVNIIGNGSVTLTINGNNYTLIVNTIVPVESGIVVGLAAVVTDSDYAFSRWEGDGAVLSLATSVTMTAPMTSKAVFANTAAAGATFVLTVNITGSGTVIATINGNVYTLTGNTVIQAENGISVDLTAVETDASYTFSRWVFSDPSLNSLSDTVSAGYVSWSLTATAVFVDIATAGASYELIMDITGNGTVTAVISGIGYEITGLTSVHVEAGARASFAAISGGGSLFAYWMIGTDPTDAARVDGTPTPPSGTTQVSSDMYVEATFVADDATFTITVSVDPPGPGAAVTYNINGGTQLPLPASGEIADIPVTGNVTIFFAYPAYHIVGVEVDAQYTTWTALDYTFTNVVSDHDITVYFETGPLITAEAGKNGSITPYGNVVLTNIGDDQLFTITADPYYTVDTVTITAGSSVQTGGAELLVPLSTGVWEYEFPNVQDVVNSIEVTFKLADGVHMVEVTAGTSSTAGNIDVTRADDGAVIMILAGNTVAIPVPDGTDITIHADPSPSFLFTYWTITEGGVTTNPSASSYTITVDNDMAVGTEFVQNTGTLSTMNVSSSAGGDVSWYYTDGTVTVTGGTGTFNVPNNADVTFNAILDPATASDYVFSRWIGDLRSLLEEDILSLNADWSATFSVNALFLAVADSFDLTVNIEGGGTVSATISGVVYEFTEATTVIWIEKGVSVDLAASEEDPDDLFSRWQDDGATLSLTTSVTMTAPRTSTAVFVDPETAGASFNLTVFITGMGKVTVTIYGNDYILTSTTTIPLEANVIVNLEAVVTEPDYVFSRWEMDGATLSPATSVKMDDRRDPNAVFVDTITLDGSFNLTVNITGSGEVVANIHGNNYTLTASSTVIPVESGASISLEAEPVDDVFSRWISATSSLNHLDDTVSVGSVSSSITATAVFVLEELTLSVNLDGAGSVAVTISNADLGSSTYTTTVNRAIPVASGDAISMTATGTGGYAFSRWISATGSLQSLESTVSADTVSDSLTATAVFVTGSLTLTANIDGTGSVDVTINGETYTITANAVIPIAFDDEISMTAAGSAFSRWVSATGSLNALGSTVSVLTSSSSLVATAVFVPGSLTLTANIDGTGSVDVTINGAVYTITANAVIPIASGDTISMTATGTSGYTFSRWASDTASLHSLGGTVTATASSSLTATVFFAAGSNTLYVNMDGTGSVAVTINTAVYSITADTTIHVGSGDSISMTATGNGSTFSRWASDTASLHSLGSTVSVTAQGDLSATAFFVTGSLTLTANLSGPGSVDVTIDTARYTIETNAEIPIAYGDPISMTATGTGSAFSRWVSDTGSLHSLNSTVSVTASGSLTATAFFVTGGYTLSANIDGSGSVVVTINSAVYTITTDTEIPIASGDSIAMTAIETGSTFSRWVSATEDLRSLGSTVTTTATGSLTATAVFVTGSLTLTANLNGTGSVTVTINSAVYTITANTVIPIAFDDEMSMTAAGSAFSRWVSTTESLHSLGSTVSVNQVSGSLTATAVFVTGTLTLTANLNGTGSVLVTINSQTYTITSDTEIPIALGDSISMVATETGSTFSRWVSATGTLHSLGSTVSATVSGSLTATAFFIAVSYTLSANMDGTGSVAVTINGAVYTITTNTEIPIASDDEISMTATGTSGYTFSRWISGSEDLHSLNNTVSETASGSLTATAVFVAGSLTLTANLNGTGSVAATIINGTGSSTYTITANTVIPIAFDDEISMTATGTSGYTFSRWVSGTGTLHSLDSNVLATASGNLSATAFFVTGGYTLSANIDGTGSVAVTINGAVYTITSGTEIPIASGDPISMTATGSTFSRWISGTEDLHSLNSNVSTTASGSMTATAVFVTGSLTLTANLNGSGSVEVTINNAVSGSSTYTVTANTVIPIDSGDSISMTATGVGSTFSRWVSATGTLHSLDDTVSATVASSSLAATAVFVTGSSTLTANLNGTGSVAVTINGQTYTVTSDTEILIASGDMISMTATGSAFSRWASSTASLHSLSSTVSATATGSLTATAFFVTGNNTLSVNLDGTGSVSVTINSTVYTITTNTEIPIASDDEISMTATGTGGYAFSRWVSETSDLNSLGNTISETAAGSLTATAVFVTGGYTLSANIDGTGSVAVTVTNASGTSIHTITANTVIPIASGDSVSMTATGITFSRWISETPSMHSLSSTVSATASIGMIATAVFVTGSSTLTANIDGTGSVAVTINSAVYVITANTTIPVASGDSISMTATGSTFSRWVSATDDLHSLSSNISTTVSGSLTATAFFVTGGYTLSANINGSGSVAVTISGAAYTITANTVIPIASGDPISMVANGTGSTFSRWVSSTASLHSLNNDVSATASGSMTATAVFVTSSHEVSFTVTGTGTVTVTIGSAQYTYGAGTYATAVEDGAMVGFSASAGTGYAFSRWTGTANSTVSSMPAAALTDDITLNAIFVPIASSYTITLNVEGNGTVTMMIDGVPFVFTSGAVVTVESNIEVELSAAFGTGYAFSRWEGDGASLSETTSVFMDRNTTSTVVFVDMTPGESFELTVNIEGTGSVIVTIDGNYYTLTDATTTIRLEKGITVELEYLPPVVLFSAFMMPTGGITAASAAVSDYAFSRWEDDGASLSKTISLTMDAPKTSTLVLVDTTTPGAAFELTVNMEGTGAVTVTINGNVYVLEESTTILLEKDMVVSLEADATDAEHEFSRWEDDGASLSGAITITMNGNRTSTVVFVDVEETGASFVTVNISGGGEVIVTINGNDYTLSAASTKVWVEEGATSLTFDAVNGSGIFSHWVDSSGVVYTVGTHSADVADGYWITAYFYSGTGSEGDGSYQITLNVEGNGTVDVTFTDQDDNIVMFTDASGIVFVYGTTVTFTANDGTGSFLQWADSDGTVLSTDASLTVEIEGNFTVTVIFEHTPGSGTDLLLPVIIAAALAAIGVIAYIMLRAGNKT